MPIGSINAKMTSGRHLTPNQIGALWMLASAFFFTIEASLIKFLGHGYPPTVILFWRQLISTILLLPLILKNYPVVFRTTSPRLMLFRSVAGVGGLLLGIVAYSNLPLADANAISFTRALWMTILAAIFLNENLGTRKVIATIIGFIGVLVILQPGAEDAPLGWGHWAAVGAAFLTALTILSVKMISRNHSVLTLTVYASILGLVFSAPLASLDWVPPQPSDALALVGVGAVGLLTLLCYTKGMQIGEASVMAPIDYNRLVFAGLVGLLVFGESLRYTTIIGAAIIIGAALFLTKASSKY